MMIDWICNFARLILPGGQTVCWKSLKIVSEYAVDLIQPISDCHRDGGEHRLNDARQAEGRA